MRFRKCFRSLFYYSREKFSLIMESRSDLSLSLKFLDNYDQNKILQLFNIWKHKPMCVYFRNGTETIDNDISIEDEGIWKGRNLINKLHESNNKLSVKSCCYYKQSLK